MADFPFPTFMKFSFHNMADFPTPKNKTRLECHPIFVRLFGKVTLVLLRASHSVSHWIAPLSESCTHSRPDSPVTLSHRRQSEPCLSLWLNFAWNHPTIRFEAYWNDIILDDSVYPDAVVLNSDGKNLGYPVDMVSLSIVGFQKYI